jgi:glutaminyl-tRNA synthetase
VNTLPVPSKPRQIEFARLNLNYTVMSKRKLLRLVQEAYVSGWDDPRMPTIAGLRRRGYTPASLRNFAERVGVARRENVIDVGLLEFSVREDLNRIAPRVMGVLRPLRVVIENYPEGQADELEAPMHPDDASLGMRRVPFSKTIYIEREDFLEDPPKKFFRLAPGREVRLRSAYFITCTGVIKDADGKITELRATYDPATRGGDSPDGRKPKATLHWVSAEHAVDCEVRLYDRLFDVEDPEEGGDFLAHLNPDSLEVVMHAKLEPSVAGALPLTRYQFERLGYFCVDRDSTGAQMVFNRTATLKESTGRSQQAVGRG